MRWLILMLTSVLLGACAGSIRPQTHPIESALPHDPIPTDRVDPMITATTAVPTSVPDFRADLPELGVAPELNNEVWLNTDRPLRLAGLHGKVVLIDMWTFG